MRCHFDAPRRGECRAPQRPGASANFQRTFSTFIPPLGAHPDGGRAGGDPGRSIILPITDQISRRSDRPAARRTRPTGTRDHRSIEREPKRGTSRPQQLHSTTDPSQAYQIPLRPLRTSSFHFRDSLSLPQPHHTTQTQHNTTRQPCSAQPSSASSGPPPSPSPQPAPPSFPSSSPDSTLPSPSRNQQQQRRRRHQSSPHNPPPHLSRPLRPPPPLRQQNRNPCPSPT